MKSFQSVARIALIVGASTAGWQSVAAQTDAERVQKVVEALASLSEAKNELSADTPHGHVEAEGRGTAVLEKRGNRWLVVQLHTSGRRKSP